MAIGFEVLVMQLGNRWEHCVARFFERFILFI